MKKNTTFLSSLLLLIAFTLSAQIPAGYYSSAEGKSQAALKTQLATIVSAGAVDKGYDFLYSIYQTSDNLPNGKVWDMYSIKADGTADYYFSHNSDKCGSYSGEGSCYNREHTFCDSWLGNASPQRSDAHHLIPTDGYVNNRRSSLPHGKVKSASWTSSNGSKLGSSDPAVGYSGTVFEPIDEFKGDFARMYFYVATRYESKIAGWKNNGSAGEILDGTSYPAYKSWFYNLMVEWNALDPVSQKEIDRNNVIYSFQKNRNPYIDYPELADYIWGTKQSFTWTEMGGNIGLISPSNASVLNFGKVAFQQTDTASVFVKGVNLKGDLSLAITGLNANLFSLPVTTISQVDATAGYKLIINYNALAIGTHAAILTISGAEMGNVTVNLQATASDDFMALPATNITASGFTANWSSSANATAYSLDVFTITSSGNTQAVTLMNEEFNSGLPSNWTKVGYADNTTETGTMRMASGSTACTLTTPALNLSAANNVLSVRAKQYSNDTGAPLTASINGQALAVWTTTADYQTFSVPLPVATTSSTLTFAASSNKRVYLDNVVVGSQAAVQTKTSVSGYPLILGNVLNYNVVDLHANSTYFYTVTPVGNSTGISDRVELKTDFANATSNYQNNKIYWSVTSEGLLLKQIETGTLISLYDFTGKCLQTVNSQDSNLLLKLNKRGIYLLQLQQNGASNTIKVLY